MKIMGFRTFWGNRIVFGLCGFRIKVRFRIRKAVQVHEKDENSDLD